MTHPDRENTLTLLGNWQAHHAALEKMLDGITASIGLDINGPMFATVWALFDAYTGALAAEVGDSGNWLEWFQSENGMGAKGMAAGYDKKVKPIKNLNDLWRLIEEGRARS